MIKIVSKFLSVGHNCIPDHVYCLNSGILFLNTMLKYQSKKGGNDQESIQSSTTPDPGYHMAIHTVNSVIFARI